MVTSTLDVWYTQEIEEQLNELTLLARGNILLVEEALKENLSQERVFPFFWRKRWKINVLNAGKYIRERVREIDERPVEDSHDI